jgi:hypothetical protein
VTDPESVSRLLRYAGEIADHEPQVIRDLARWELERLTLLLKQLGADGEAIYEGEDTEWLLGLTAVAQRSIDAVEASRHGGRDLEYRYLQAQRAGIAGGRLRVRRVYVVDGPAEALGLATVLDEQRAAGVEVRLLDESAASDELRALVFDFVLFDESVSYEITPALRPGAVRTHLGMTVPRVRDRVSRFARLWEAATPA